MFFNFDISKDLHWQAVSRTFNYPDQYQSLIFSISLRHSVYTPFHSVLIDVIVIVLIGTFNKEKVLGNIDVK